MRSCVGSVASVWRVPATAVVLPRWEVEFSILLICSDTSDPSPAQETLMWKRNVSPGQESTLVVKRKYLAPKCFVSDPVSSVPARHGLRVPWSISCLFAYTHTSQNVRIFESGHYTWMRLAHVVVYLIVSLSPQSNTTTTCHDVEKRGLQIDQVF